MAANAGITVSQFLTYPLFPGSPDRLAAFAPQFCRACDNAASFSASNPAPAPAATSPG